MKDQDISIILAQEKKRQQDTLMLIPSENYTSSQVRQALSSYFVHKYAEGYPAKRYYQGNKYSDEIENLAIERAQKLFGVPHANVQPLSGSPANSAVYFSLLNSGDKIMGLDLRSGGHLTHGHPKITFSGRYFTPVHYSVNKDGFLDYDEIEKIALLEKPQIIVSGTTAYSRILDFERFGKIAQKVGAWHLADISHIVGLVIGKVHPSPVPWADVVMTTTHKTLRGPRGAIILVTKRGLSKDPDLAVKIDRAVFPGLQGGPHIHTIAAIALALKEASTASFSRYAKKIVENAKALAFALQKNGLTIVSGGTDNHLMLIDLRPQKIDGAQAAVWLENAGIVVNKNAIPHDPNPPFRPSGLRLGTPAVTTRGMAKKEMVKIADWIGKIIGNKGESRVCSKIAKEVKSLCQHFPIP